MNAPGEFNPRRKIKVCYHYDFFSKRLLRCETICDVNGMKRDQFSPIMIQCDTFVDDSAIFVVRVTSVME